MRSLSVARRSGKCRLGLVIGENLYMLRRSDGPGVSRGWLLKKSVGEGGEPVTYLAYKSSETGELRCSCPDHTYRGARCKHLGALVACGLLSARKRRPSEEPARKVLRWLSVGPRVEGGAR